MSELFSLLGSDAPADAQVSALLESDDRRSRLAAYAYLYANPDPSRIEELIGAVTRESTPFGQYWGVRALRRLVQAAPAPLDMATRRRLEQLVAVFDPDTDGAGELRALLGETHA